MSRMLPFHFFSRVFSPLIFSRSSFVCRGLSSSSVERSTCGILNVASRYAGFSRVKNSCLITGTNLKALYTRDCASVKSRVVFSHCIPSLISQSTNIFSCDLYLLLFSTAYFPNYFNLLKLYVLWKRIIFIIIKKYVSS